MANSPFIYGPNGATSLVPGGVTLPASTSGTLQIQPAATTTSYAVEMPATQGAAASTLVNDGAGNLSWQQLATTQNVYQAIYTTSSAVTYSSGQTAVIYTTPVSDSLGLYNTNTGIFTVPKNGTYQINAGLFDLTTARAFLSVFKNGAEYFRGDSAGQLVTATSNVDPMVGISVPCVVGDTLSINLYTLTSTTSGQMPLEGMSIVLLNPAAPGLLVVPPATTRTVLTSGSGTYTTPANVTYIKVRMVGGGAGGSGATTTSGQGAGTSGGATVFGPFTANGGVGADASTISSGGSVSFSGGTVLLALTGASGGAGGFNNTGGNGLYSTPGMGGVSPFGGAGAGGAASGPGVAAIANTGSGGGGGSYNGSSPTFAGAGGGAGGYIEAYIASPASTYSYTIGAGGSQGGGYGTGTNNGGNGASGIVIVEEFYPAANSTVVALPTYQTKIETLTTTTSTANAPIIYGTTVYDTSNSYNTSTGVYTVPVAGIYKVTVGYSYLSSGTADFYVFKNGTASVSGIATASNMRAYGSGNFQCAAGDTLYPGFASVDTFATTDGFVLFEKVG